MIQKIKKLLIAGLFLGIMTQVGTYALPTPAPTPVATPTPTAEPAPISNTLKANNDALQAQRLHQLEF